MDIAEWKQHGYPFDIRRNKQVVDGPNRYVLFLANSAISGGCDIDENQPDRWQWLFSFTRALDTIYDKDVDEDIDPEQLWSTKYQGQEYQCGSGESVKLDDVREKFEQNVEAKKSTTDPQEYVKCRIKEMELFMPMGELAVSAEGIDDKVLKARSRFNKGLLLGGISACLIDDCTDIKEDFETGIHKMNPTLRNKLILGQQAINYGIRGLLRFPPSQFFNIAKLAAANFSKSLFETSLQITQNRVRYNKQA